MDRLPASIVEALFRGRAVLVSGQDLERGETEGLVSSLQPRRGVRQALLQPNPGLRDRINELRVRTPGRAHVEISQVPWALVLSSALDTRLASALEAQAPAARRVRRRFVNEGASEDLTRSATVLEVMHLSLTSRSDSLDGVVPDHAAWTRIARLVQPRVLERLRDTVTPAHFVVIDGVTNSDPMDRDDLAAALQGLDGTQIVLCETQPNDAAWLSDLHPNALILQSSLADLLRHAQDEHRLQIPEILRADDLAVSVKGAAGADRRISVFRAEELRDIRRHIEIVGEAPVARAPANRDERLQLFREFIRTPRLRPEYKTFTLDFCLERESYRQLLQAVAGRIARVTGAGASRQSEAPILLEGFPGSGRTTGLHWLGVKLRQEGWFVCHLNATAEELDLFAIEQIMRLCERRLADAGALVVTVLLADGIGREGARRVDERLRRAGRRSIVVATGVAYSSASDPEETSLAASQISLDYELSGSELESLTKLLADVGISVSTESLRRQAGVEGFLGMLDRLDYEAREGLAQVLRHEFDRFVPDIALTLAPKSGTADRGALGAAIAAALERAGRRAAPEPNASVIVNRAPGVVELGEARDLLRTVFSLAWLDKPAPLDLLARRFPRLFAAYEDLRVVANKHGFLTEKELDSDGTPALAVINPGVARILRTYVVGAPRSVLEELEQFAKVVAWPTGVGTGGLTGWPRFVYELLRSVGPRGAFRGEFGSAQDLKQLIELIRHIRIERDVHAAQMLMLEAISLREWVERANLPLVERDAPLDESRQLLEQARDELAQSPRSPARDYFLAFILAAYATTLRRLMEVRIGTSDLQAAQAIAQPALAAAQASQTLQDNWHPFDAAALIYYRLAQAWRSREANHPDAHEHYIDAVNRLGVLFDLASELGDLPNDQIERKNDRVREYLIVTGQLQLARDQAISDAKNGRLSGLCYLLRREAIDPSTNRIRSPAIAAAALAELASYRAALDDLNSVILLHRLWVGAYLADASLDGGPHLIRADAEAWQLLQTITQRRLELIGDDFDAAVGFWLALALLELGNVPESRRVLQRMQTAPIRTRRRHFDPLIVLSDPAGAARIFRALVRRREERENLIVYVRDLDLEMQLSRRYLEPGEAVDLNQGDIFDVHVALNYRGPMAVGPRWARRSLHPARP